MGGTGVIDQFLEVFTRYIDGGFGLLGGEVAFIATTLIVASFQNLFGGFLLSLLHSDPDEAQGQPR